MLFSYWVCFGWRISPGLLNGAQGFVLVRTFLFVCLEKTISNWLTLLGESEGLS
jgi:hypothetical protein